MALDIKDIAKRLGASRVEPLGGRQLSLVHIIQRANERFEIPEGGGWPSDPAWEERRLVSMRVDTLERLEKLAESAGIALGVRVGPMQVAAILLELGLERLQ